MIGTSLGTSIQLYTNVAALTGAGGASIAAWADLAGARPRDSVLRWTNGGAADVLVGNATTPAQLYVDGVLAAVLFEGHQVTVTAGQSIWCPLPANMPALGNTWGVLAPMTSGAAVVMSLLARRIDTTAPTASEIAAAVLAEVIADHAGVAGSLAQTLMLVKGLSNGNVLHDSFVYDVSGKLTSSRIRVFPTAADVAAGTNLFATFTVTAVNGTNGPTNFRVTQS